VKIILNIRDAINSVIYKRVLKRIFFTMDPEVIHDRMTAMGKLFGRISIGRWLIRLGFYSNSKSLHQDLKGIRFYSPVGLAAGFDKNAELVQILPELGFGFAELGSVTGEKCSGNPKPRLWRLKKSEALVVYYGLKNDGAEMISARLKSVLPKVRKTKLGRRFVYGLSIAKTNCAATVDREEGIRDYAKAYRLLRDQADYVTVNISCPNAFGGQPFTDAESLEALLLELDKLYVPGKPVLVKLSPDLDNQQIDEILEVSALHKVDGFICTNLTKNRDNARIIDSDVPEKGGISGKVVEGLSNDLIAYVYKKTKGKKIIVGVGGVFSAEDAYNKIRLGANLVQLITGMVFEGPAVISRINLGLVDLMKRDGFSQISEVVGVDARGSDKG
jgi:dihydroorotate dehydrogenase